MTSGGSLSALLQRTGLDDHEDILKQANERLKKSQADVDAQCTRVVALLQLDRYDDALRCIDEGSDALKKDARFEWAYALYKTGRFEDADRIMQVMAGSEAKLHLQAQTAYRSEDFSRAKSIYQDIGSGQRGAESGATNDELRINRSAVEAQDTWASAEVRGNSIKPSREDMEHFETAFNFACAYLARAEWKQAEMLLRRAHDLCSAAEDLSKDEKKTELLPIQTQLVYVLSKQGKLDEAKSMSEKLDIADIFDPATKKVARVNQLILAADFSNPYLAQRTFKSASRMPAQNGPFAFQKRVLEQNDHALALRAHKFGKPAKDLGKETPEDANSSRASAGVIDAAAAARLKTGDAAIRAILPALEKRPGDVGLLLTIVQLYSLAGNAQAATSLMEKFFHRLETSANTKDLNLRFIPGLVAVIVSLYAKQNRLSMATQELSQAAQYWRRKSKVDQSIIPLFKAAGAALLDDSLPGAEPVASDMFQTVIKAGVADEVAVAGSLAAAPDSSEQFTASEGGFPPIEKLTQGIDVTALENAGIVRPQRSRREGAGARKRPAEAPLQTSRVKKVRKTKMPKDYDQNKVVDPERWVPIRDRTSYRPKGKKKHKGGGGAMATQGGFAQEDGRPSSSGQAQQSHPKSSGPAKSKNKKGKGGR